MTNRFDRAASRLDARLSGFASSLVTYTRPSTGKSVTLLASRGQTPYEVNTESGVVVAFESRDFVVAALDLKLDGVAIVPKKDDQITDGGRTYTVTDMGGQQCFQSVVQNLRFRIHTKVVGAQT
jgi:hypothetical protein